MGGSKGNDNAGLITRPPYFLAAALVLAAALDRATGLRVLAEPGPGSVQSWAGATVAAGAVALAVSGVRTFKRASTNVNPFQPALKLVTGGPYRFTRNPMYLGMVLFLLGTSLLFSLEWGLLLTPVLWLAYDRLVVAREEAYLSRKFGAPYAEFLGRTRRWL